MMKTLWEQDDDDSDESSDKQSESSDQTAIKKGRDELLGVLTDQHLKTVEQQVAWILNQYPEARDSDIELQIRYWLAFERDKFNGQSLTFDEYRRMTRLTTLDRARRDIQNKYGLFKASPDVQRQRGKLQESEREKVLASQPPDTPLINVFIDESGKNDPTLLVGSTWVRDSFELSRLSTKISSTVERYKGVDELHFKNMKAEDMQAYSEVIRVLNQHSANLSFKLISAPKAGISNVPEALQHMAYQLVSRGIEHEIERGRLSLPIRINVWKDAEEEGADQLFLARLRQTLETVGRTRFSGKMQVNELSAITSKYSRLIQVTDLFVASMRRAISAESRGELLSEANPQHKDRFAAIFLKELGFSLKTLKLERIQDMVHLMRL